jgi:hypothetical protein
MMDLGTGQNWPALELFFAIWGRGHIAFISIIFNNHWLQQMLIQDES